MIRCVSLPLPSLSSTSSPWVSSAINPLLLWLWCMFAVLMSQQSSPSSPSHASSASGSTCFNVLRCPLSCTHQCTSSASASPYFAPVAAILSASSLFSMWSFDLSYDCMRSSVAYTLIDVILYVPAVLRLIRLQATLQRSGCGFCSMWFCTCWLSGISSCTVLPSSSSSVAVRLLFFALLPLTDCFLCTCC